MPKPETFTAIETKKAVRAAVQLWTSKFTKGATALGPAKSHIIWQASAGVWGTFYSGSVSADGGGNYQHAFGQYPHRSDKVVEINIPGGGINTNVQGLIATDSLKRRWVMHQGRLHPGKVRVTEDMFDHVAGRERTAVVFSDGSVAHYHKVACLDAPDQSVPEQMASFVADCIKVRLHYTVGEEAARQEAAVLAAEKQGSYVVPAQDEKVAYRHHADVWHALTRNLDGLGIKHSNGRIGRHGPDLRTICKSPVLFEIKSGCTAQELQQAVGQLFLYEKLLRSNYRKVIVIPDSPSEAMADAISRLGLGMLIYSGRGRTIRFEARRLKELFG